MSFRRPGLALTLLLVAGCARGPGPIPVYPNRTRLQTTRPLLILGDTRRTGWMEVLIGRSQNDGPRRRVIAAVAKARPAGIVLVGDAIFKGSSASHWRGFDRLMGPLRRARIPLFMVLGNHEYRGSLGDAVRQFEARFRQLRQRRYFVRHYGPVALVCLDSNRRKQGYSRWKAQRRWFEQVMPRLDRDPSVRAIVVFTHHPPYTNSARHEESRSVQAAFIPGFLVSRKGTLFVSGHAHGYERFIKGGKTFLVTAGAGAPRVDYRRGSKALHQDRYRGPIPRPFHYVTLSLKKGGIELVARGFEKGKPAWFVMERLRLKFPPHPGSVYTPPEKR